MENRHRIKQIILALLCILPLLISRPVQASGTTAETPAASDYAKERIAVLTGSNFPELVEQSFPKAEQVFFNTVADMLSALKANKVDAIALDEPVARSLVAENDDVTIADGYLAEFDFAFFFPKTDAGLALSDEISGFLRELKSDGRMQELQEKWFDNIPSESMMSVNPGALPEKNGTIHVATIQYPPFSMLGQEMFFGYEAELLALFGKENGYRVEFIDMNPDATIPAINSGRCDLGAAAASVTEERKEEMYFSEPDYSGGVVLAVRKEVAGGKSFFASVAESFEKTFLRENRYILFLQGIGTTLLITVLSIIFGTALGFLIFLACRRGNPVANALARAFSWLITGMPIIVLLMILYYLVFSNLPISGTAVSIIGFTLVFGAEVYGMMTTAVGAVDTGQEEAAYTLGYTDRRAFFRLILPQAMPHFMPGYRGSLVSLIKATSIVGYVAVQDLTKMGDIVRSRTYEAFFPLIAVAVIYFILAGLLILVADRLTLHFDPTRRKREDILKGIEGTERQ